MLVRIKVYLNHAFSPLISLVDILQLQTQSDWGSPLDLTLVIFRLCGDLALVCLELLELRYDLRHATVV